MRLSTISLRFDLEAWGKAAEVTVLVDGTQSHDQVPLMEGELESVKATAAQLKAAGIAHDIEMTGGAPGS